MLEKNESMRLSDEELGQVNGGMHPDDPRSITSNLVVGNFYKDTSLYNDYIESVLEFIGEDGDGYLFTMYEKEYTYAGMRVTSFQYRTTLIGALQPIDKPSWITAE